MKKFLFLIGLAVLFLHGVPEVCAAEEKKDTPFDDVKVTFKFVEAPNFKASDAVSPGKISWQHKWLVIGVEFKPVKPKDEKSSYWLDDMTMDVEVLFKFKNNKGKEVWCLFTGTSEFYTIPRDGRKHVAAMFIPPQLLDRYFPSHLDIFVKVQFDGAKPVYDKRHSESAFAENEKNARPVSNAVLPRNLTPWAIVDVDEYDLLKPAGAAFGAAE